MSATFRFKATDLIQKFGFGDGGVLDEFLEGQGYDVSAHRDGDELETEQPFGGAVLCECIRRHLMPNLPALRIDYNASLSHNPVRIWNAEAIGDEDRNVLRFVTVDVSESQVLAIAGELEPAYPMARKALPSPSA